MNIKTALLCASALCVIAARAGDATATLADALGQLNPDNDADWTADGLPRIDALKTLTGDQSLNREAVEAARPGFTREQARVAVADADTDPMAPALADGWAVHPEAEGFYFKDQEVVASAELVARYNVTAATDPQTGAGASALATARELADLSNFSESDQGKAELVPLDRDFDGDPEAVEALEAELVETSEEANYVRGKIDELKARALELSQRESDLRQQIEANRPRSGNMTTIQQFLQSSQQRRIAAASAAKG